MRRRAQLDAGDGADVEDAADGGGHADGAGLVGDDVELVRAGEGHGVETLRAAAAGDGHDVAADAQEIALHVAGELVDGAEERIDERRCRLGIDLAQRCRSARPCRGSSAPARSASSSGLFLVVGDEQRGDVQLVVQAAQPAAQLLAHLGVERAERLVEQQHARLDGERAGERDALALAAGKLRRDSGRPASRAAPAPAAPSRLRLICASGRRWWRGFTRRPKATLSNTVMCRNSA